MLLEFAVLQEKCDKYYSADSLNALFETIPETCIVDFLWEMGFFYLTWTEQPDILYGPTLESSLNWCNFWNSIIPLTWTICSGLISLFRDWKQLWAIRDIYSCRTTNMSWRKCVVIKQIQSKYTHTHTATYCETISRYQISILCFLELYHSKNDLPSYAIIALKQCQIK